MGFPKIIKLLKLNKYNSRYSHFKRRNILTANYASLHVVGISREQLVLLGYLLGCDYTAGLEGVGIVSAMELLRDFPGDQLQPLEKIR